MRKMMFLKAIGFFAVVAGFGAIVMLLWNLLMPAIFGLSTINFWQAVGILVLCRMLFGGFGGMRRHAGIGREMYGANPVREKWMKMTPEERKNLFDRRMERFAGGGFFDSRRFDFDGNETGSEKQ